MARCANGIVFIVRKIPHCTVFRAINVLSHDVFLINRIEPHRNIHNPAVKGFNFTHDRPQLKRKCDDDEEDITSRKHCSTSNHNNCVNNFGHFVSSLAVFQWFPL